MKIVKQSVRLLIYTKDAEKLIERAGRVCYKSEDKITADSAEKFIRMLIKRGHLSVLEHASATIHFVTDRGISHEIVRHRIASYSQESTRYCNYGKSDEITVIEPPGLDPFSRAMWEGSCVKAEITYLGMLQNGLTPQIARSVLPTCLKTEIVVTANFREWLHIFSLRTAKSAHPQIVEVMKEARSLLRVVSPGVFCP